MTLDRILFSQEKAIPAIAACDHYAGTEKLITKSLDLITAHNGAFDLTCDLEDGAAVGNEAQNRRFSIEVINSERNSFRNIGVRVHDFTSPFFASDINDIIAKSGNVIAHITVPKVAGKDEAVAISAAVAQRCREHGIARSIPLHFLIETPMAVEEVWAICGTPGLRGLDFGCMDFVSFHHGALDESCMISPGQFEHPVMARAKTRIVAAALGNGLIPVHNVTTDFADPERTFDDALRARAQFGFLRMWSIHPNQIPAILDAMRPSMNEIAKACEILLAAEKAQWAPIRHANRLHDRASYRFYWNVLRRAHRAASALPNEVMHFFPKP